MISIIRMNSYISITFMTVAETIKKITREHLLKNKGLALGQCLTAVGWVGGTVPELKQEEGLVELSMADVAGGGIAVGIALAQRRPIYIVRYQGFQWYNAPMIINYAAKSKDMWGIPCPIFIRSIAMDGGIGPVASGSHHSMYSRMPGVPICAPMTPKEYVAAWEYFMSHDDPLYVSEHRRSFAIDYEIDDSIQENPDITILAISSTRLNAIDAIKTLEQENIKCNLIHLFWLKPFEVTEKIINAINKSKCGALILDGDFENGILKSLAYDISQNVTKPISILGLEERSAGFAPQCDNLPPSAVKICNRIKTLIKNI
ncbi:MAG: hypothetical protein US74_C0001G0001 [Parcubacteria group bacterium GW2011_GWA2_38_13]|nr:MAG: hypothetical protein US74_C0001G0001 [Parcubacteria group bacterium GW2011_GWA2_38_13]